MGLLQQFIINYQSKNLFFKKDRLLVATSGGLDSVVLCKLCQVAELDFGIAHCNFQLRGDYSERDEAFVRGFARQLSVPFFNIKFDTKKYAQEHKISTQVAARSLRYKWFEEVAASHGYDYILTAHHADDNIETVLMSFFRGTAIRGLTGIPEKNGKLRRPLLFARRKELEEFLNSEQLSFVQDESNLHDDYTRNYFRNKILPLIGEVYPEALKNILGNIERLKETNELYKDAVAAKIKKLVEQKGKELYIPVLLLKQQKATKTILYEILRESGFHSAQLPDILQLLQSESGKYVASDTHRILRDRKHLIIALLSEISSTGVVIENTGEYSFAGGKVDLREITTLQSPVMGDSNNAFIDARKVAYPLILRPWKAGDYFYPLGMQKKKKVSRFLIDQKLSIIEKEKVWVIETNKKIIWVVGRRIDDRFKITGSTDRVLRLTYHPV